MSRSKKKSKKSGVGKQNKVTLITLFPCALFFFLPLLFSKVTQSPLIPIRWIFLTGLISIFITYFPIWQRRQLNFSKHSKELKWFLGVSLAFLIWGLVCAVSGVNAGVSYQELLRLVPIPILTYLVFYIYIHEQNQLPWLYRAIALSAGIQGLVALGQGWGIESLLSIPGRGGKVYGIMANGNLLGSAQVLAVPFVWLATLDKNHRWSLIAKISMALVISSIVIAASRSPWLALVATITPLIITIYLRRSSFRDYLQNLRSTGWIFALVSVVLSFSVILTNDKVGRTIMSRVATNSQVAATDKIAIQAKANITGRLDMWKVASHKVFDHPVSGIGPGNWKIMSPLYESEFGLGDTSGAKNLRPHNVYLQVANEYGLPGLLLFLAMGLIPVILCFKSFRNAGPREALVLAAMLGVFAALATDFLFSFSHERIVHMSLLALASGITFCLTTPVKQVTKTSTGQTAVWVCLLLLSLASLLMASERWQFENHWLKAKAYLDAGNNEQSLLEADKGTSSLVKIGPIANTMEVNKAQALKNLGRLEEAIESSHSGLKQHPYNFALINNLGTIFVQANQFDSARHYFERARHLHPADPVTLKNLAVTYFNLKDYSQCIQSIDSLEEKDQDDRIKALRAEATKRKN